MAASVRSSLSLGELEAFARAGLPRFLALFHARIASEQSIRFERCAQIGIGLEESAGNGEPSGPGLPGHAPAGRIDRHVVGVDRLGHLEGLQKSILERSGRKIILKTAAVNFDFSGPGRHANAGHRSFAATSCDKFF